MKVIGHQGQNRQSTFGHAVAAQRLQRDPLTVLNRVVQHGGDLELEIVVGQSVRDRQDVLHVVHAELVDLPRMRCHS